MTRRNLFLTTLGVIILTAIGGPQLSAGEVENESSPVSSFERLYDDIEAAKDRVTPITPAELNRSRQSAMNALRSLGQRLDRGGSEHAAGWKSYLNWEALEAELAKEIGDPRVIRPVYDKLRRNYQGLEFASFRRLRSALLEYSSLLSLYNIPDEEDYFRGMLDQLKEQLATYETDRNFDASYNVGRILGILEGGKQVPELVASVRRQFAQPNIKGWVSEEFLSESLKQPVDDVTSVSELILGTQQNGTAHTTGVVEFVVEPNSQQAQLVAVLNGTTISNNIGRKKIGLGGCLTIHSTGTTSVYAKKPIFVTVDGIKLCPSRACCNTSTQIHCIQAPELISGIVRSQVYKKKGQAEQIASRRAERRIEQRFDAQVEEAVSDQSLGANIDLRSILMRLDSRPQNSHVSTTDSELLFRALQANSLQLAAAKPPEAVSMTADFGLMLHVSALNNLVESALGGQTLTRDRLVKLVNERSDDAANELTQKLGDEDWTIRFPGTKPIVIRFIPDGVRVTITGSRFTRGDQVITDAMEIDVSYQVAVTGSGLQLKRIGDLKVDYVGEGQRSAAQVAFRSFAQDKFSLLFPETIETSGFELPGRLQVREIVRLSQFDSNGEWITLGWNRTGEVSEAEADSP